jgi:hypothetical protein
MPTLEETLRQHKSGIVPIPNMECGGPGSGRHKLYHGTTSTFKDNIKQKGLYPRFSGLEEKKPDGSLQHLSHVWLTDSKEDAKHYAQQAARLDRGKPYVVVVDADKLPNSLSHTRDGYAHYGKIPPEAIIAMSDQDFDVAHTLSPLEPIPTGWDTKVENPGDRKLTPEEKQYNTELARHQGGAPSYATVAQIARTTSVDNVY